MTVALIIAGGSGQRMHLETPKQFLSVDGKPILVHTLERFQKHPAIDAICTVTLASWENTVQAYANKYAIDKLRWIVPGGATGQESICHGVRELERHLGPDDCVMIHDGVRPMVSDEIISANLAICHEKGNAITVIPCVEAMCRSTDGESSIEPMIREELWRTQTPQSLPLRTLSWAHDQARDQGIAGMVSTVPLLQRLGVAVHFSPGSEKNLKITTRDDLSIFRALLRMEHHETIED